MHPQQVRQDVQPFHACRCTGNRFLLAPGVPTPWPFRCGDRGVGNDSSWTRGGAFYQNNWSEKLWCEYKQRSEYMCVRVQVTTTTVFVDRSLPSSSSSSSSCRACQCRQGLLGLPLQGTRHSPGHLGREYRLLSSFAVSPSMVPSHRRWLQRSAVVWAMVSSWLVDTSQCVSVLLNDDDGVVVVVPFVGIERCGCARKVLCSFASCSKKRKGPAVGRNSASTNTTNLAFSHQQQEKLHQ